MNRGGQCIAYESVVCSHPLAIIGVPICGYLYNCTSGIRIELLHVAFAFATTQKWFIWCWCKKLILIPCWWKLRACMRGLITPSFKPIRTMPECHCRSLTNFEGAWGELQFCWDQGKYKTIVFSRITVFTHSPKQMCYSYVATKRHSSSIVVLTNYLAISKATIDSRCSPVISGVPYFSFWEDLRSCVLLHIHSSLPEISLYVVII